MHGRAIERAVSLVCLIFDLRFDVIVVGVVVVVFFRVLSQWPELCKYVSHKHSLSDHRMSAFNFLAFVFSFVRVLVSVTVRTLAFAHSK